MFGCWESVRKEKWDSKFQSGQLGNSGFLTHSFSSMPEVFHNLSQLQCVCEHLWRSGMEGKWWINWVSINKRKMSFEISVWLVIQGFECKRVVGCVFGCQENVWKENDWDL